MKRKLLAVLLCVILSIPAAGRQDTVEKSNSNASADIVEIMGSMDVEQKIAQMIMPAIRYWEGNGVTDLTEVPALAEALRRHQYGLDQT